MDDMVRFQVLLLPSGWQAARIGARDVRNVSPDTWLKGTVARLAPFGAFVTVTAPEGGASADGTWPL